jgi:hypothetical protein
MNRSDELKLKSPNKQFEIGDLVRFKKTGSVGRVIDFTFPDYKVKWLGGKTVFIMPIYLEPASVVDVAKEIVND